MKHRGLGGVYQRGKVWWLYYSFRGRPLRESSGSTVRNDAVKLLKRRMGEMGKGQLHGPDMEKTTFDDLVKIIQDEYRMNERRSVPRMKTALNFLRAHFGMSHARDITLDRLNSYVATRLDGRGAPASIRYELSILRRAFRLAQRAGKAICPPLPVATGSQRPPRLF